MKSLVWLGKEIKSDISRWFRSRIFWFLSGYKGFCRADLYIWADFPRQHRFREFFGLYVHDNFTCVREESTYCGKCKVVGRVELEEGDEEWLKLDAEISETSWLLDKVIVWGYKLTH